MDNCKKTTKEEYQKLLKDVIHMMVRSIEGYDGTFDGEAQRLAVCILPIIRDTDEYPSIVTKLGLTNLYFYHVCPDYNPNLNLPFSGLAIPRVGKETSSYMPRLDLSPNIKPRKFSFEDWKTKPVVVDESKNIKLSREMLVLKVANTMSGLIYNKLNDEFNSLILDNCMGWIDQKERLEEDMISLAFASVRHIAYELLQSLYEQVPEYFGDIKTAEVEEPKGPKF